MRTARRLATLTSMTVMLSIASVVLADDLPVVPDGDVPAEGRVVAEPAQTTHPVEKTPEPIPFDSLWLSIVGGVSLLLVIWMVRTESSWGGNGG